MAENNMGAENPIPDSLATTPKPIEMGGTLNGLEVPKIEINNEFHFTGEELEQMRKTPMNKRSGAHGSVLDHIGQKADIKTDPIEVAIQPDLSEDDKRRRIDVLYSGFHQRVAGIVKRFANPNEDPDVVAHDLDRLIDSRSDIIAGKLKPIPVEERTK